MTHKDKQIKQLSHRLARLLAKLRCKAHIVGRQEVQGDGIDERYLLEIPRIGEGDGVNGRYR